jgi:hypothetical protein
MVIFTEVMRIKAVLVNSEPPPPGPQNSRDYQ